MTTTMSLFYTEYRSGNCSLIEAARLHDATAEAYDIARAFGTRVRFVREATADDRADYAGAVRKAPPAPTPHVGGRARGRGIAGIIEEVGDSPTRGGTMIVVAPDAGGRYETLYEGEYVVEVGR